MYPTAFVGIVLVIAAIQFARCPDRTSLPLVRRLGALVMIVASLGFVSGVVKSFTSLDGVEPAKAHVFALIGFGESLVNVGFGLFVLVIATAATCVGLFRDRANRSELADPHQR
jgi:hypothetical protein